MSSFIQREHYQPEQPPVIVQSTAARIIGMPVHVENHGVSKSLDRQPVAATHPT